MERHVTGFSQESHIALENIRALGFDWEICSFCNSENRHALFDYGLLKAQVQGLANRGIIKIEREVMHKGDCMATSLCPLGLQQEPAMVLCPWVLGKIGMST